jgi:hypothetical protein
MRMPQGDLEEPDQVESHILLVVSWGRMVGTSHQSQAAETGMLDKQHSGLDIELGPLWHQICFPPRFQIHQCPPWFLQVEPVPPWH